MNSGTSGIRPPGERYSQSELQRRWNVLSWACQLLNVTVWVLAFRVADGDAVGVPETVLWFVVAVRVAGEFGLLGSYKPVPYYLDRVAWLMAVLLPLIVGDWPTSVLAFTVCTVWYLASALGSNYYARANIGWEPQPR